MSGENITRTIETVSKTWTDINNNILVENRVTTGEKIGTGQATLDTPHYNYKAYRSVEDIFGNSKSLLDMYASHLPGGVTAPPMEKGSVISLSGDDYNDFGAYSEQKQLKLVNGVVTQETGNITTDIGTTTPTAITQTMVYTSELSPLSTETKLGVTVNNDGSWSGGQNLGGSALSYAKDKTTITKVEQVYSDGNKKIVTEYHQGMTSTPEGAIKTLVDSNPDGTYKRLGSEIR
jgi:hypothetical protein